MIVSWNWLSQYVRLDMPVEKLAERLALTGLNHEATEDVGGDLAIDLEVTSNRPDCLSHIGVAREISVIFGKGLCVPNPKPETAGPPVETITSVSIEDPDLCPRFTARVVTGATIKESPWWMRKRLETLGVRPISNVVDVTNYVMFECGQPLHAYDLDTLEGKRLVVRRARRGETLVAINNKTYEPNSEMLVIADAERPVGLAGVMGGLHTEIGSKTRNILIEAARFDAMNVRKTGRALGLNSAASYRFERPIDPERTEWASRRCAELILQTAGGTLHPGVIDVGVPIPPPETVTLRLDQIPRVLGIAIDRETVARILLALGLQPAGESFSTLAFRPPSWRSDLTREIDLIEEVARIHGYEHIPEDRPVPLARSSRGRRERIDSEIRSAMTGMGFDEACTFSLVATPDWERQPEREPIAPLKVEHSTRKREVTLRRSLTPSLLSARGYNDAHGVSDAAFFEIANVYLPRSRRSIPEETVHLAMASGHDFLGLKGVVEALLDRLHARGSVEARPSEHLPFLRGRQADLFLGNLPLGTIGEVDPAQFESYGLRSRCSAAELEFSTIDHLAELIPQNRPLAVFPAVERDLSLVVDRALPWSELENAVRKAAGGSLESLSYLDVFSGGNLPRRQAQPSLRHDVPQCRADAHRRGSRKGRAIDR